MQRRKMAAEQEHIKEQRRLKLGGTKRAEAQEMA